MPRLLITGIQGQTGSFLADHYVTRAWDVHGTASMPPTSPERDDATLHAVNFMDRGALGALLDSLKPELIVNLAAISSVAQSWKSPALTMQVNAVAVAEIAEYALRQVATLGNGPRVIQASSSEIFESLPGQHQTEETPVRPRNPYGVSKAAAHFTGQASREAGVHWTNAILYNHESLRRPESFLSRKVTKAVAEIALGLRERLTLGTLSSIRDWGWAPDVADALVKLAALEESGDYIVSTGTQHSVEEFVEAAFRCAGLNPWREYVDFSDEFVRPNETPSSAASPQKLMAATGWQPTVTFEEVVRRMVENDILLLGAPA
jgi:GDPmannose 4,6-dehydratase